MVWVALVIGVFLFYKFVEPSHKKTTYKVVGVLAVVLTVGVGGFLGYESWKEGQRKNGLTVKLDFKNLKQEKTETAKIIDSVVMKNLHTINSHYPDVDLSTIKNLVFLAYLDSKLSPEFDVVISSEEYDALFKWVDSKSSKDLENLENFEQKRLDSWIRDIPDKKKMASSSTKKFQFYSFLNRAKESFTSDEKKQKFLGSLDRGDLEEMARYIQLKDSLYEELYKHFNSLSNLETTLSFEVCNKRGEPLNRYSFYVSGYEKGRSTANPLRKSESYGSGTQFNGDIIVEPNKCSSFVWTGDFKFYNKYEVTNISGYWQE